MAKVTSPTSGQPYGIRRVCQAWGVPRSSFYAAQAPAPESTLPAAPGMLIGDKAYDADDLRQFLAAQGTTAVISPMPNRSHKPGLRLGGRVAAATGETITLDAPVLLDASATHTLRVTLARRHQADADQAIGTVRQHLVEAARLLAILQGDGPL